MAVFYIIVGDCLRKDIVSQKLNHYVKLKKKRKGFLAKSVLCKEERRREEERLLLVWLRWLFIQKLTYLR